MSKPFTVLENCNLLYQRRSRIAGTKEKRNNFALLLKGKSKANSTPANKAAVRTMLAIETTTPKITLSFFNIFKSFFNIIQTRVSCEIHLHRNKTRIRLFQYTIVRLRRIVQAIENTAQPIVRLA